MKNTTKLLLLLITITFITAQNYSLEFDSINDNVVIDSYNLNGDFTISVDAALISGNNGVMFQQINGGESHLAFQAGQIRFGVKASSCGSSGGWH